MQKNDADLLSIWSIGTLFGGVQPADPILIKLVIKEHTWFAIKKGL